MTPGDGWASIQLTDDLTVHAKGGRDAAGRLIVTELLISAPEVTTTVLRQINPPSATKSWHTRCPPRCERG